MYHAFWLCVLVDFYVSLWTQYYILVFCLEKRKMATNTTGLTYGGQEKTPSLSGTDADFAAEAGSPGGLFHLDYKRHDDLSKRDLKIY